MLLFVFATFMTYIDFIRPDWVELPRITPPSPTSPVFTTPVSHLEESEFLNRALPATKSPRIPVDSSEDSDYRGSRSYEDSDLPVYDGPVLGRNHSKSWRSRPSPFSSEYDHDPQNYYKWRNVTYSRVKSGPFVTDSVDYTIMNPEITPFESNFAKPSFPKTVIINSKTPMKSHSGESPKIVNRVGVDGRLDTTAVPMELDEETFGDRPDTFEDGYEDEESDYPVEDEEEDASVSQALDDEPEEVESSIAYQVQTPPPSLFSFNTFLTFLRNIQDNFLLKTAHSVTDKFQILENMRDRLLEEISSRVRSLFGPPINKQRRSIFGEKDHGIDFPSSEGALMTIAFLTFAVFLVKLVLQVITSIKYKYVFSTGTTGAASIKNNLNTRKLSLRDEEDLRKTAQILSGLSH